MHCRAGKERSVLAHDGLPVHFYVDRFDHAFKTAQNWSTNRHTKDRLDCERLVRIRWIEPAIAGLVIRSACWSVGDARDNRRPHRRMYLVWDENYIVWLDPTDAGDWRFSSAYRARDSQIRGYIQNGEEIWRRKE